MLIYCISRGKSGAAGIRQKGRSAYATRRESSRKNRQAVECCWLDIIHCYNEFQKLGITPFLYEHDRPASIDFLKNLSKTYKEISDEIDAEMEDED